MAIAAITEGEKGARKGKGAVHFLREVGRHHYHCCYNLREPPTLK